MSIPGHKKRDIERPLCRLQLHIPVHHVDANETPSAASWAFNRRARCKVTLRLMTKELDFKLLVSALIYTFLSTLRCFRTAVTQDSVYLTTERYGRGEFLPMAAIRLLVIHILLFHISACTTIPGTLLRELQSLSELEFWGKQQELDTSLDRVQCPWIVLKVCTIMDKVVQASKLLNFFWESSLQFAPCW